MTIMNKSGLGFFRTFGIFLLIVFIVIELAYITHEVVLTRSIEPIFKELGGKFLYTTRQLSNESKQIILQGGIEIKNDNFMTFVWSLLKKVGLFFTLVYTIFIWLKVLSWLFAHSPLSTKDKAFRNVMLAILVFLFLQSFLVLTTAAINKEVNCFSGCNESVTNYLLTPVTCFYDFFQAIPYIIKAIPYPAI